MKLFEAKPINTGRQVEADFAKMICIIGMIIVHAFEETESMFPLCGGGASGVGFVFVVVLDALFGAATFMFCMGFGITYSPKNDAPSLIKRGAKILLFGYLLNAVRYCVPELINGIITGDMSLFAGDWLEELFDNDILQFAGLVLMLFGLLKKLKLSDIGLVIVAVILSIVGSIVRNFDFGAMIGVTAEAPNLIINQIVGLFVGTTYISDPEIQSTCFPLLNWFIFVVAGYLFAKVLQCCKSKGKFYAIVSCCGAVIVSVYMLIAIPNGIGMMGEDLNLFYHLTTPEALICIVASITVFGGYYALTRLLPNVVSRIAVWISKRLTNIYIAQWLLFGATMIGIYTVEQLKGNDPEALVIGTGATLIIAVCVLAASVALAGLYRNVKKKVVKVK